MRTSRLTTNRTLAAVALLALVAAACGGSGTTETTAEGRTEDTATELSVVVSTTVLGDIVANVVGDAAVVEVLLPVGADPHDFQVSSAQTAAMQTADLVVVNGLLLEEGMADVIAGLEEDGANVLEVGALLDPIPFSSGGHDHDHGEATVDGECDPNLGHVHEGEEVHEPDAHEHAEESCDPHVWMDPLRMADAARLIAAKLAALDATVDWMANADGYADELAVLDAEIIGRLDAVEVGNRKLVTNHDAFGYFADRYDFEIVDTVIPGGSSLSAPSSADLAELVEVITDEGVSVIFAETIEPSTLADAVAAELGTDVKVVELYTGSLGETGSDASTYVGMLRVNSQRISEALS